ncbi:uncharacterized protein [Euphorbia lathyris]|uniref:uncharacterized protein n=1 Tax=Euphorbia lathyris TaxID=212925 RepID=UPI003313F112
MRRSNSIIDLEIGGNLGEDFEVEGLQRPSAEKVKKKLDCFRRSGSLNSIGTMRIYDKLNLKADPSGSSEKLEKLVGEEVTEKARDSEEEKKKRIAKPPRPPKAPLLDMADIKLLREMTELAKLKRARVQRIKALKKKRKENASSLSINILPMLVTIVFFIVIIFQGLLSSRV